MRIAAMAIACGWCAAAAPGPREGLAATNLNPALLTLKGHHYTVHNPSGAPVTEVHLVQSAHLDIGCKTFGCSAKAVPGEPDLCLAHHVEPYAYHIVNRWLDEFLLLGVAHANATRGSRTPYRHMVQPWIMSIFFDCANANMLAWPGSGWEGENAPVLHCPNASTVAEVAGALRRGDLFMHAFPHNAEPGAFPGAGLFDAALALPQAVAKGLGIKAPTAVSQRDVPGWPRSAIPLLRRRGINGISFGAGQPPGKPDAPPVFVWRDEPSGTDVVATYESGYGVATSDARKKAYVFVLPNGVALACGWSGDNSGPPPLATAQEDFASLQAMFPSASIKASTFDQASSLPSSVALSPCRSLAPWLLLLLLLLGALAPQPRSPSAALLLLGSLLLGSLLLAS